MRRIGIFMKEFRMLIWITQLGLSVVMPLAGFILVSVWLKSRFEMGVWIVICGFILGIICAVDGLRNSLIIMEKQDKANDKKKPPLSFNDHE